MRAGSREGADWEAIALVVIVILVAWALGWVRC